MSDWFKLSGSYYRDPKVLRAGEAAEVLFVRGLSYCCEHGTGGRIPKAALPYLAATDTEARTDALVREGLWVTDGDEYVVRSWDAWQQGVDALTERRKKDRDRKRSQRVSHRTVRGQSADTSAEFRTTEIEIEKEETTNVVSSARARATRAPDIFAITDQMRSWASGKAIRADLDRETERFLDHHRAKGTTYRDWTAAWRTWMSRADDYAPQPAANAQRGNLGRLFEQ